MPNQKELQKLVDAVNAQVDRIHPWITAIQFKQHGINTAFAGLQPNVDYEREYILFKELLIKCNSLWEAERSAYDWMFETAKEICKIKSNGRTISYLEWEREMTQILDTPRQNEKRWRYEF